MPTRARGRSVPWRHDDRAATELAIDVVLEATGRPLAWIEGMRVREVELAAARDWLATLVWEPVPATLLPPLAEPTTVVRIGRGGRTLAEALPELQRLAVRSPAPHLRLLVDAGHDPAAGAAIGFATALASERPDLDLRCIELAGTPSAEVLSRPNSPVATASRGSG